MLDTSSCQKQSKLKVKPWMTPSILWSVGIKKKIKNFSGSPDKIWYNRYKYYRSILNNLNKKRKKVTWEDGRSIYFKSLAVCFE